MIHTFNNLDTLNTNSLDTILNHGLDFADPDAFDKMVVQQLQIQGNEASEVEKLTIDFEMIAGFSKDDAAQAAHNVTKYEDAYVHDNF